MYIIDASVAIKWFVPEPFHQEARALLSEKPDRIAPDWLMAEVANVLWKQARQGIVKTELATRILQILPKLICFQAAAPLTPIAYRIARQMDHPVYDCLYLALAKQYGGQLITADTKLATAASANHYKVRFIGKANTPST